MATTGKTGPADSMAGRPAGSALLAAGGILAAVGASSCCVLPLVLFGLGVSGAWISNLTALAPYQPIFVAVAIACLALEFARVYRRPATCADGEAFARPLPSRMSGCRSGSRQLSSASPSSSSTPR